MKTLTAKSRCAHVWVSCEGKNLCMWCGIPKVRKSEPVQRLKIPRAEPGGGRNVRYVTGK